MELKCALTAVSYTHLVAISGIPEKQAEEFANSLASDLSGLHEKGLTPFTDVGHIGLAFHTSQNLPELLSEADMALRAAQILSLIHI